MKTEFKITFRDKQETLTLSFYDSDMADRMYAILMRDLQAEDGVIHHIEEIFYEPKVTHWGRK